jgi:hypothetical protein
LGAGETVAPITYHVRITPQLSEMLLDQPNFTGMPCHHLGWMTHIVSTHDIV